MIGNRPTRADRGIVRNAPPALVRFGHLGVTHFRMLKYSPRIINTLCGLSVQGQGKKLKMAATYDPPADAPVCQVCAAERDRRLENWAKRQSSQGKGPGKP